MKKMIPLYVFAGSLIGCTTFKNAATPDMVPLTRSNYQVLDGDYATVVADGKTKTHLFWDVITRKPLGTSIPEEEDLSVELKMTSRKALQATLYKNDSLIQRKRIRGRLKDGYFQAGKKTAVSGVPPLLWGKKVTRMRIGKQQAGGITVEQIQTDFGMFLMFVAGPPARYNKADFSAVKD